MIQKGLLLFVFLTIPQKLLFANSLESTPVGPGVIFHHEYQSAGPWHIYVLEIELANEWIYLETVKANDLLAGYEKTSAMAIRNDQAQHRVIGAINGDFYGTGGIPVGAQVIQGILLKLPTAHSIFGYTDQKKPIIDIVSFNGTISTSRLKQTRIHGVNETRDADELIVFNKYFGTRTGTNFWGTEIVAEYLTARPMVNDTTWVRVVAKDSIMANGHGNNTIPGNGIIISGHGSSRVWLNDQVFVGDTLALLLQLSPVTATIRELIGGMPRLIRNGIATVEWSAEGTSQSFAYDRHPRTAIGFSRDSTKVYWFTVDGRQPGYSVGMSLFELANLMLNWGVYQAVNLDGGGSTTMVVRGKVVNRPSDAAGERSVANALMVVSKAPTGQLSQLKISPTQIFLLSQSQTQFSAQGFDQYYNPLHLDPDSLVWSCESKIGNINNNGFFTAGTSQDSGYVYVAQRNIRDSAKVYITSVASIKLLPNPVILKIGEKQTMNPEARDAYGNLIELMPTAYQWSVSSDIGTISNDGVFTATHQGQGTISATYHAITGSAAVFVGISSNVILDDFQSINNWTLSGVRVNLSECNFSADNSAFISPPTSGKLGYSLTTGGTSALYLNCSILVSGTPEAIGIHVYGDGKGHWLRGELEDADKEKFLINFTESAPGINWANSWRYLMVSLKNAIIHWSNPSATLTFPITLKRIYLAETDDNKKNSGIIYLDDLTVHFIETDAEQNGSLLMPNSYLLGQNYPNPFNPETKIPVVLPRFTHVTLEVYNTIGEKVAILLNDYLTAGRHIVKFNAVHLTSGVYFYRMDTGDFQEIKKMALIR